MIFGINLKKKSQVVVFIFIGLVLALSLILFFAIKTQLAREKSEELSSKVDVDIKPVVLYVENCLKIGVKKAIDLASQQGGFIKVPEEYDYIPLGAIKIPIYFHLTPHFPDFWTLKTQIEDHVLNYTEYCLNKTTKLRNYYSIKTDFSRARIKIDFSNKEAYAKLFLPTEIELLNKVKKTKINSFSTKVPTKFYYFYMIANATISKELESGFLEYLTIETIAAHLPYQGYHVGFNHVPLPRVSEAREKLYHALFANMHYLYFDGFISPQAPQEYYDYYQNQFHINLPLQDPEVRIEVMPVVSSLNAYDSKKRSEYFLYYPYSSWGDDFIFDVEPKTGDFYKPISLQLGGNSIYVPFLPVQIFNYKYLVDYKIWIRLSDKDFAESFNFGIRIHYDSLKKHLMSKVETLSSLNVPSIGAIMKQITAMSSFYDAQSCEGSIPVTIDVVDEDNYQLDHNAKLYFQCLNKICYLGEEKKDVFGVPTATILLPECVSPTIIAVAEGYNPNFLDISGVPEPNSFYQIQLHKLLPLNVRFKLLYEYNGYPSSAFINLDALDKDEKIMLGVESQNFQKSLIIDSNNKNTLIYLDPSISNYSVYAVYLEKNETKALYAYPLIYEFSGTESKMIVPLYEVNYFNKVLQDFINKTNAHIEEQTDFSGLNGMFKLLSTLILKITPMEKPPKFELEEVEFE